MLAAFSTSFALPGRRVFLSASRQFCSRSVFPVSTRFQTRTSRFPTRHIVMSSSVEQSAPATPTTTPPNVAGVMPVYAQCMLRINNPDKTCEFYGDHMGMKLMTRFDFPKFKFSLFFFAYTAEQLIPPISEAQPDRASWLWGRPEMTVELTWNWPADSYEESRHAVRDGAAPEEQYVSGNEPPKGFGYIQISVRDVPAAVAYLRQQGVTILDEPAPVTCAPTVMSATVADPDGYHVRLVGAGDSSNSNVSATPPIKLDPVYSSVMIRVKDISKAIPFFRSLGFNLIGRQDDDHNKFTDFYLAYLDKPGDGFEWAHKLRVCTLTLRQEWGVDKQDEQPYTNGNTKPYRGYGHVGVILDDIYYTMGALEAAGYKPARKPGPFADVGSIAFIEEPSTNYWVELISRAGDTPTESYEQPVMS